MSDFIAELKQEVVSLREDNGYLQSVIDSFLTGDVPNNASLLHMIFAKYGRIRLEDIRKKPALLGSGSNINKE